jgi:hypothetical protein
MSVVTPQILHKDVGGVGLGREAVITDIDAGVSNRQAVHVERIKSIGVFGKCRCVGRVSIDENIVKDDIIGANKEVGPARRV